jgi:hypothetical protein
MWYRVKIHDHCHARAVTTNHVLSARPQTTCIRARSFALSIEGAWPVRPPIGACKVSFQVFAIALRWFQLTRLVLWRDCDPQRVGHRSAVIVDTHGNELARGDACRFPLAPCACQCGYVDSQGIGFVCLTQHFGESFASSLGALLDPCRRSSNNQVVFRKRSSQPFATKLHVSTHKPRAWGEMERAPLPSFLSDFIARVALMKVFLYALQNSLKKTSSKN